MERENVDEIVKEKKPQNIIKKIPFVCLLEEKKSKISPECN